MKARVSPRKRPLQARSKKTVEAILAATARILVREGYEATTTTRVADVAGVSIGSLYQYFPTREALVAALVDRHLAEVLEVLSHTTATADDDELEEAVGSFVKTVLAVHAVDPQLHVVIMQNLASVEGFERIGDFARKARAVVRDGLVRNKHRVRPRNVDLAAFVLVHAVTAVVNACAAAGAPRFDDDELCKELTLLVLRYLEKS
jgi:AcrR family transcriptional regulator